MKLFLFILLSLNLTATFALSAPEQPPITDDLLEEMADPTESTAPNTVSEPPESVGPEDSAQVIEGEAAADSKPDEFEEEKPAVSHEVAMPADMPDFFAELEKIPHIDIEKFRSGIFATIGGLAVFVLAFLVYFLVAPTSRKKRIAGDLLLSVVSLMLSAAAAFATFFWNFTSLHAPDGYASLVLAAKYAGGAFVISLVLIHVIAYFALAAAEPPND